MARDAAASANDIALGGMTTPPPRALGGARLEVLASCRARVRSHSPATPSPPSWCALPCGSMASMRTRLARAWPSFSMATTFHAASTIHSDRMRVRMTRTDHTHSSSHTHHMSSHMYIIYMMNIISSQYSDEASQSGDTASLPHSPRPGPRRRRAPTAAAESETTARALTTAAADRAASRCAHDDDPTTSWTLWPSLSHHRGLMASPELGTSARSATVKRQAN